MDRQTLMSGLTLDKMIRKYDDVLSEVEENFPLAISLLPNVEDGRYIGLFKAIKDLIREDVERRLEQYKKEFEALGNETTDSVPERVICVSEISQFIK